MDIIIINNLEFKIQKSDPGTFIPFVIPDFLKEESPFLVKYLSQKWTNRTPIILDHDYFDITADDINQSIFFMQYYLSNKDNIVIDKVQIDNVALVSFIMDYFGNGHIVNHLKNYVNNNISSIDPIILFIYDKNICLPNLDDDDLKQLLEWGFSFYELIIHMSQNILLDIHSYSKYLLDSEYMHLLDSRDINITNEFLLNPSNLLEEKIPDPVPSILDEIVYKQSEKTLHQVPVIWDEIPLISDEIAYKQSEKTLHHAPLIYDEIAYKQSDKPWHEIPLISDGIPLMSSDIAHKQSEKTCHQSHVPEKLLIEKGRGLAICDRKFNNIIKSNVNIPKFVNKDEAMIRFNTFTEGMLNNITWDNIILSGGSISLIINDYDLTAHQSSDIDLFVWGDDRKYVINRLLKELRSHLDIVAFQRGRVITIIVRNHTRNIQIIDSGKESPIDIINAYDLTTSKALYDGSNFMVNPQYIHALLTKCSYNMIDSISLCRIVKNLQRGFHVLLSDNCLIKGIIEYDIDALNNINIFTERSVVHSLNKYLFATTESEERLLILMRGLFGNDYELLSGEIMELSTNNWKKDYDKISLPDQTLQLNCRQFTMGGDYNAQVKQYYIMNSMRKEISIKLTDVVVMGASNKITTNYSDKTTKSQFMLTILLNKDHEDYLLPFQRLFSDDRNIKLRVRHCENQMINIYKDPTTTIIYPRANRTSNIGNKPNNETNCFRGRIMLTSKEITAQLQRHSLMGDIIITPHVYLNHYSIVFKLVSFNIKTVCQKHTIL